MEISNETFYLERFIKAYRNKKTNIYRVFVNVPTWVGMKVFEFTVHNSIVKWNLLAECIYQGNNQEVAKLYNEVVLTRFQEWVCLPNCENFLRCLGCSERNCHTCDNSTFLESII